jgi:excinuclease UvrABC helicase subunit UvrB
MLEAAENLEFEKAGRLRDEIARLKGESVAKPQVKKPRRRR